jgi:hypothetical protein
VGAVLLQESVLPREKTLEKYRIGHKVGEKSNTLE